MRKQKIRRFHALLGKPDALSSKEGILSEFDACHVSELSEQQLDDIIRRLSGQVDRKDNGCIKRLRSRCLSELNKLGIYYDNNDWDAVNSFLLQPRIAGKPLFRMDEEELRILHRKLCSIRSKNEKQKRGQQESEN